MGCRIYHVAAPLLHESEYFRSFQSYRAVLQELVIDGLGTQEQVQILVVGIDSESSARSLAEALSIFRTEVEVTFADRCSTPLQRIEKSKEASEDWIRTEKLEISPDSTRHYGCEYDIVVADCFLKQFESSIKPVVLRALVSFLRSPLSRLVVREYFGSLEELLTRLWKIKHAPSSRVDTLRELLLPYLPEIERYVLSTGALYAKPDDLLSDVRSSSALVVDRHINNSVPDQVFILRKVTQ